MSINCFKSFSEIFLEDLNNICFANFIKMQKNYVKTLCKNDSLKK